MHLSDSLLERPNRHIERTDEEERERVDLDLKWEGINRSVGQTGLFVSYHHHCEDKIDSTSKQA